MNEKIPPDDSIALGQHAAEIAAKALEELGSQLIREKALDIARQLEIYLKPLHFSSIEELKQDPELTSIAVVRVGTSGYSAVHDTNGINHYHVEPWVVGVNLKTVEHKYPQFWEIVKAGMTQEAGGFYEWPIAEGYDDWPFAEKHAAWPLPNVHKKRKYMHCVPIFPRQIAPLGLVVAVTITIDEFLQPSREISHRILKLSERVDEFTRIELRRNSQLRAVNDFSRKISSFLNADELLTYVVNTLQNMFQLQCVRIFLVNKDSKGLTMVAKCGDLPCPPGPLMAEVLDPAVVDHVARSGKPYLSEEAPPALAPDEVCDAVRMAIPIKIGRNILGVLDLVGQGPEPFADIDLFSIWPLADQVAIALDNARLHNELRELAVVDERNRIAREIHDTLAQGFAGISMLVESARLALRDQDTEQAALLLERTRSLAKEKLAEARRSVQSLRPNIVLTENLETLIQGELDHIAGDMRIETALDVSGAEQPVSPEIKMTVLRICQEALNNIKKHAHASQVKAALTYSLHGISFYVQDNGVGFDPQIPAPSSYGLTFIGERARLVGGSVVINSEIGKGTKIYVSIPL